jgi:hypothetical protein
MHYSRPSISRNAQSNTHITRGEQVGKRIQEFEKDHLNRNKPAIRMTLTEIVAFIRPRGGRAVEGGQQIRTGHLLFASTLRLGARLRRRNARCPGSTA